jgi:hypothetical protein
MIQIHNANDQNKVYRGMEIGTVKRKAIIERYVEYEHLITSMSKTGNTVEDGLTNDYCRETANLILNKT